MLDLVWGRVSQVLAERDERYSMEQLAIALLAQVTTNILLALPAKHVVGVLVPLRIRLRKDIHGVVQIADELTLNVVQDLPVIRLEDEFAGRELQSYCLYQGPLSAIGDDLGDARVCRVRLANAVVGDPARLAGLRRNLRHATVDVFLDP